MLAARREVPVEGVGRRRAGRGRLEEARRCVDGGVRDYHAFPIAFLILSRVPCFFGGSSPLFGGHPSWSLGTNISRAIRTFLLPPRPSSPRTETLRTNTRRYGDL